MTRESVYDEDGELAASFCPTDVPLSDKGRAALEAMVKAVRKDMAAGPGPQLGTCTVCGRELRLTRAGVVWWHQDRADWRGQRCDGAGKPPRAASTESADSIPLSDQALYHLSGQHPECDTHPTPKESK